MNSKLIREDIDSIQEYQPGKPIQEVKRELGLKSVVKLASNENPYGPSAKALSALKKATSDLHRYPEGNCYYLKKALCRKLKVSENCLLFGNGSDELIDVILKTIHAPAAQILTADITFVEYKISAQINGFEIKTVPLKDFTFDLDAIAAAITSKTRAIFIANPNNPTGTYVKKNEVERFLNRVPENILIVFDEAYFEFADTNDFPALLGLINKKNIVILRTFSKIYGLAGLRIGYMIAHADFIKAAQKIKQPFNVNSLAQTAATAALNDKSFIRRTKRLNAHEKKRLYAAFSKMGIWYKKSATNFLFVRFNENADKIFKQLLDQGVIIREMKLYELLNYARITIGTKKENTRLLSALSRLKLFQSRSMK